jgi:hypothetical protein
MANEPLDPTINPSPDLEPEQNPVDQQSSQNQTPIDTLNDILDMGDDAQDTFNQVKDLSKKAKEWTGKGAKTAETGVEGAAEAGAEAAVATEAAEGATLAAGKTAGKNAAKGTIERGAEARLRWARTKIAEGRAKVAARQATRRAERVAAKQAGKQIGKAAAKYGAKAASRWAIEAASGLADAGISWLLLAADVILTAAWAVIKKYGKYIAAFAAVMIALPGLIFFFAFASIGATLTAGTPAEKAQTVVALALGADPTSTREVIITAANTMKDRLTGIIRLLPGGDAAVTIAQGVQAKLTELVKVADQPEQRRVLMAEINTDLQKISAAHPDVLYGSGSCAELKPYIDSGKFKEDRPGRKKDMQTIWKGILNRGNHGTVPKSEEGPIPANPRLCTVIKFILDNGFTLGSATITYGHRKYSQPARKIISQHYVGEAIDLALVNGVAGGAKWQEETRRLQQLLQDNAKALHLYELWGPQAISIDNCSKTTRRISGHDDHIHLGIANDEKIRNTEACR